MSLPYFVLMCKLKIIFAFRNINGLTFLLAFFSTFNFPPVDPFHEQHREAMYVTVLY